jgi:hypothetical protein
MVQAGANGLNRVSVCCEWAPDYTTPERKSLIPGMLRRGGAVGLSVEYLLANGRVPTASA